MAGKGEDVPRVVAGMQIEVTPPFPGPKRFLLRAMIDGFEFGRGEFDLKDKASIQFTPACPYEGHEELSFRLDLADPDDDVDREKHQLAALFIMAEVRPPDSKLTH